jgi:hypothetical protein
MTVRERPAMTFVGAGFPLVATPQNKDGIQTVKLIQSFAASSLRVGRSKRKAN